MLHVIQKMPDKNHNFKRLDSNAQNACGDR